MVLILSPLDPEKREEINAEKAEALVASWKEQLLEEQTRATDGAALCNKVILRGKTYKPEAAKIIADFLTSTEIFNPSIASGITSAIIDDIIASQNTENGLSVLQTISDAFQDSKLVEVDLSDNAMGTKGIDACRTVLCGPTTINTLESLSLCNNGLSKDTMEVTAVLLTQEEDGACVANNLRKIHFYNNMSDNEGCESFRKIIAKTSKLEDIRMSGTRAKAPGSLHIAAGLKDLAEAGKLSNVVQLDLADNSFGDCYEDLADALRSCKNLEYLDISECTMGEEGISAVCAALVEAGSPLKFLSLGGNDLGEDSNGREIGQTIAGLIKSVKNSIESFSASENELKSPGIRCIARALKTSAVKEIYLNQNEIGSVGAYELIAMADHTPNLQKIELDLNGFLPDVVEGLTGAFGDKLVEMEDNNDEDDYDEDLDEDDLKESADADEDAGEKTDADVDALADALGEVYMV
eukprot:jgi/Psemu1/295631/fgenesh1_pm.78_\